MFGIPLEALSMLASTIVGGYMKMKAQEAQDKHERKMAQFQSTEDSIAAARAMQSPSAAWTRRFIVICLMGMAFWIMTAPMWGITTYMPVAMTEGGVFLFGLIDTTKEYTQYQGMDGMITPEWLPFAIMQVLGFYFGTSAMKR